MTLTVSAATGVTNVSLTNTTVNLQTLGQPAPPQLTSGPAIRGASAMMFSGDGCRD